MPIVLQIAIEGTKLKTLRGVCLFAEWVRAPLSYKVRDRTRGTAISLLDALDRELWSNCRFDGAPTSAAVPANPRSILALARNLVGRELRGDG